MPAVIAHNARQLGVVHDYDGLHRILRDRIEELNVARSTVDHVAGLPSGYSGKILSPQPTKRLGKLLLGSMLGGLALRLVVEEDPEQFERIKSRLVERQAGQTRPKLHADAKPVSIHDEARRLLQNAMRRNGRKGVRARMKKLTPEERSRVARQAARARWATVT